MPRQPDREPLEGEAPARSQESFSAQGLSALLEHLEREPDRDLARAFDRLLKPGAVVGRFELQREIGSGGFGVVFEARDLTLGRSVAFKAIRPGRRTRQLDDMLLREAEAAARLQHENIVALYDFGRGETGPYLVLELLRGETLAARLARGPVSPAEAVHVGTQVARALAHAHGAGLLHRDLKPSNVFLTASGGVKILDLGLAHLFGDATGASGTPAYMAPEQWRSEPQDGRTDLFALGVMLFELLAGRRPYEVREDRSTALDPGPEPRLDVKRLPPRLARLVERCIAKDPGKRPASARAVLEELLAIGRAVDGGVARRRTQVLAVGLAAALLALAAGGAAWWRLRGGAAAARVPVAVADFDDRTGEAGLEGLSSLLVTSLSQSRRLEVLPRSRMRDLLRAAGKQAVDRIDEQLGREVARLARVDALLLATLYRFGAAYALEVRGVEPGSDRELFALKEQTRGKEGLPDLLDRVAEGVRRALREPSGDIGARSIPLAQAATPNLEAWRHYFHGMECSDRYTMAGSYEECLADFAKAVELDPAFALAHFQTAYLYFWQGRSRADQRAALEPALRHEDRATERDRQRIRAWGAFLDGRDDEAKRLLGAAAEAQADDKYGWYLAAEIPFHRDELAEATPLFRRAHDLDPTWLMATQHLAYALGSQGRLDELRAVADRLEALGGKPGALAGLCYADLWIRPERSVGECARAVSAGAGVVGSEFEAIALLATGTPEALEAHLRKMAGPPGERTFDWFMTLLLRAEEGRRGEVARAVAATKQPADAWLESVHAEALVGLGDLDGAWRAAERLVALDASRATNLAVHFAYAGDLDHAAALARYLPAGSPRVAAYEAVVRWRRGDPAGAAEALRPLAEQSPLSADPAIPFPLFLRGEALAEAGQPREAAVALERVLAMPRSSPSWIVPRALLTLAQARERTGDRAGARAAATRLRQVWRDADERQPRLADARALWARMGLP